jgi:hypothetical protein
MKRPIFTENLLLSAISLCLISSNSYAISSPTVAQVVKASRCVTDNFYIRDHDATRVNSGYRCRLAKPNEVERFLNLATVFDGNKCSLEVKYSKIGVTYRPDNGEILHEGGQVFEMFFNFNDRRKASQWPDSRIGILDHPYSEVRHASGVVICNHPDRNKKYLFQCPGWLTTNPSISTFFAEFESYYDTKLKSAILFAAIKNHIPSWIPMAPAHELPGFHIKTGKVCR